MKRVDMMGMTTVAERPGGLDLNVLAAPALGSGFCVRSGWWISREASLNPANLSSFYSGSEM
jgi:hypothetical protein